jgi:transcriptional regulator with XRE-family HTH domain
LPVHSGPKHRHILGETIRKYRKEAKLSQERLAEKADLSTVYVSRVECGKENISVDALVRVSKALNVSPRDLLLGI